MGTPVDTTKSLLTTREAAAFLRCAVTTLAKARVRGDGPPYVKFGKLVLYDPADLARFVEAHKRSSTSEAA
jgi:hypothetical protein